MDEPSREDSLGVEDIESLPRTDENEIIRAWLFNDSEFRYVLTDLIARGGGGEVWEGQHLLLKRVIAAKRPLFSWFDASRSSEPTQSATANRSRGDSGKLRAFLREAMIGAVLEHPNILPVYDLGKDMDGSPMIIMRRVRGKAWNQVVEEDWGSLRVEDFLARHLPILVQVGNAVAYAHSRGIVHRDIKPSQVMLGDYGEVQLMDWGLSVVLDPDVLPDGFRPEVAPLAPTIQDAVSPAGTPAYMAPEQTLSDPFKVGPWTDVFLLGATLYFLLTGTPPYRSESSQQAVLRAGRGDFLPLGDAVKDRVIPPELEKLVLEAMTVNPGERKLTVRKFVNRLSDFMSGFTNRRESEEITSRVDWILSTAPPDYAVVGRALSMLQRARSYWPGNPRIDPLRDRAVEIYAQEAIRSGDLKLARLQADTLPDGAVREGLYRQIAEAEILLRRLEKQRKFSLWAMGALIAVVMVLGMLAIAQWRRAEVELGNTRVAEAAARRSAAMATAATRAAEEEAYFSGVGFAAVSIYEGNPEKALETLLRSESKDFRGVEWGVLMAQLAADEATLLSGTVLAQKALFHTAFSPSGDLFAVVGQLGHISIWDYRTLTLLREFQVESRGLWSADFDPAGDRLLVVGLDGSGYVIDVNTGEQLLSIQPASEVSNPIFRGASFSTDGRFIATSGNTTPLAVYNSETGEVVSSRYFESGTYDTAWSPDGNHLIAGIRPPMMPTIVRADTLETVLQLETDGSTPLSVVYSHDGTRVAIGTNGGFAYVFNAATGERLLELGYREDSIRSVAFSPDDAYLATVSRNGRIHIHNSQTGNTLQTLVGARQMEKIAFHPTENILIGTAFDTLKMWNLDRLLARRVASKSLQPIEIANATRMTLPAFPLQRQTVWSGYEDRWVDAGPEHFFRTSDQVLDVRLRDAAYSPDRTLRAQIGHESRNLAIYRGSTEEMIVELVPSETGVVVSDFTPNGKYLVAGLTGRLRFYETETFTYNEADDIRVASGWSPFSMAFSPDGRHLVFATGNGELTLIDMESRDTIFYIERAHDLQKPVPTLAFSGDGRLLGTASSDQTARVWNAQTGELVTTLSGHSLNVLTIDLSPDGSRAITVGMDDRVRMWEIPSGREIFTLHRSANSAERLKAAVFSKDGRGLFIANHLGNIAYYDTLPWDRSLELSECAEAPSALRCLEQFKRRLRLSPEAASSSILW